MNKIFLCTITLILLFGFIVGAEASIYLNIYLDQSGEATFIGKTNETSLNLPPGIKLEDGKIFGFTQSTTTKIDSQWTFIFALENAELTVILPDGAAIQKFSEGKVTLDKNKISVYSKNSLNIIYTIETQNPESSWQIIIIIIVSLAVLIIIGFLGYKLHKRNNINKDRIEIIKKVLNDREKIILDTLKKTGKMKSSQIRKLTDLPKASFSRHVQELVRKNLVKASGEGKNKFLEIINK